MTVRAAEHLQSNAYPPLNARTLDIIDRLELESEVIKTEVVDCCHKVAPAIQGATLSNARSMVQAILELCVANATERSTQVQQAVPSTKTSAAKPPIAMPINNALGMLQGSLSRLIDAIDTGHKEVRDHLMPLFIEDVTGLMEREKTGIAFDTLGPISPVVREILSAANGVTEAQGKFEAMVAEIKGRLVP